MCVCVCVSGWVSVCVCARAGVCLRSCSLNYPVCHARAPYFLGALWLHDFFRRYLIQDTIVGWKIYWLWNVSLDCLYMFCLKHSHSRRIQRDIVINVKTPSHKVTVIFVGFQWNLNLRDIFLKKSRIPNSIKIRPVGAEMFHADGHTEMKLIAAFHNFANAPKIYH